MPSSAPIPFASTTPDVGPGSVWPVAVLCGAVSAAVLAASAYVGVEASGVAPAFGFGAWVGQHALWGTLAGVAVTWILRLGHRLDPQLAEPSARRAAAARLATFGVLIGLACLAASSRAPLERLGFVAGALLAGIGALLYLARLWLRSLRRIVALPRLDPLRVAAVVALLLVPLQYESPGASLARAWRVMLGG